MERKVSPMLILCSNLWSLPYLPSHPSLNIPAPAVPVKHQCLSSWCCRTKADHSHQILGITVPTCRSLCSLCCLSSQTKLFEIKNVFMFQMWYSRRVHVPKVRWGITAHELSAEKGGTLPQAAGKMQNCGQDESRSREKQTTHKVSKSIR